MWGRGRPAPPVVPLASRTTGALSRRAEGAADQAQSKQPAFVELPAPLAASKQALFELDNGAGITRRVQLLGYDSATIETLARSFWNAD